MRETYCGTYPQADHTGCPSSIECHHASVTLDEALESPDAAALDKAWDLIRDALLAEGQAGYYLGRSMRPDCSDDDLEKHKHARQVAAETTVAMWTALYTAVAK